MNTIQHTTDRTKSATTTTVNVNNNKKKQSQRIMWHKQENYMGIIFEKF